MPLKSYLLFLVLLFSFDYAFGWQSGKTESFPLNCETLKKVGAERLYLEITAESGSYGVPYLVGRKGNEKLWEMRSPANEVNLAKFEYSCKGSSITISDSDPGPNSYHHQTLTWNGKFIEKIVKFEKGSDNWSVYKETSPGQSDRFRFWAKKDQVIKIEMSNIYAPSIFNIYEPGSKEPLKTLTFGGEKITWSGVVKKTGDFIVVIDGTAKDSRYHVKLWIN